MKKLFFLLSLSALGLHAQNYYSFTLNTGIYSDLTGTTTLINGDWKYFKKAIKLPFLFKLFSYSFIDSIYFDNWGSLSVDTVYNQDFFFFGNELNSRGMNLSEVSYVVQGTSPTRVFKIQFKNAGLLKDAPLFVDSINCQLWLYENTNIIEIHFGPGKVNSLNWMDKGPYIRLSNPNLNGFMLIEDDPVNPTINTTNIMGMRSLKGMPSSGTIYRFTPSQFPNGIQNSDISINIIQNKISFPTNIEVNEIKITNLNGQFLQLATHPDDINFSNFAHGVYILIIDTKNGVLVKKLVL